jgi:hypothetical protein
MSLAWCKRNLVKFQRRDRRDSICSSRIHRSNHELSNSSWANVLSCIWYRYVRHFVGCRLRCVSEINIFSGGVIPSKEQDLNWLSCTAFTLIQQCGSASSRNRKRSKRRSYLTTWSEVDRINIKVRVVLGQHVREISGATRTLKHPHAIWLEGILRHGNING